MTTEYPKLIETPIYKIIAYSEDIAEIKRYYGNNSEIIIPSEIAGCAIKHIAQSSFSNCKCLKKVVISEGVTYIGVSAFSDCTNLEHITLPKSLETIYIGAFNGCRSLRSLNIPDNVTHIEVSAFRHLEKIEVVVTPDSAADKQMGKKYMGFTRKKEFMFTPEGKESVWIKNSETDKGE